MRSRSLFGVALGCSMLWAASSAALEQAAPNAAESRSAPPWVRIMLVGPEPAPSFRQRLLSWFQRETRVTVVNAPTLRADQILGAGQADVVDVWLDLRLADVVHVYLVASGKDSGRYLVRDLAVEHGMDELDQERLAQVVFSSALAVWQGRTESPRFEIERRLGTSERASGEPMPPSAAPPPTVVPVAPAEQRPGARPAIVEYSVRVGYALSARGPEGLGHGPELWGTLLERRRRHLLGGFLMATYLLPFEGKERELTLKLTGMRARVGALVGQAVGEVFRVELGVGIGADIIHYQPSVSPDLSPLPDETETRPVVGAFLGGSVPAGAARIVLAVGADVQLARTIYQIQRGGTTYDVLKPWPVAPGLGLLIAFGGQRP